MYAYPREVMQLERNNWYKTWPLMGAMLQSTMPLMKRRDRDNCLVKCRLNISAITNFFGGGSFDHPSQWPRRHLLTRSQPSSNLANVLWHAWSYSTTTFQEIATQEQLSYDELLLTQDTKRSGLYTEGTVAWSVTNTITIELCNRYRYYYSTRENGTKRGTIFSLGKLCLGNSHSL